MHINLVETSVVDMSLVHRHCCQCYQHVTTWSAKEKLTYWIQFQAYEPKLTWKLVYCRVLYDCNMMARSLLNEHVMEEEQEEGIDQPGGDLI
jgi:hypothetical protein